MELVDVVDSKSTAGDSVPVRVRSPAPSSASVPRNTGRSQYYPGVAQLVARLLWEDRRSIHSPKSESPEVLGTVACGGNPPPEDPPAKPGLTTALPTDTKNLLFPSPHGIMQKNRISGYSAVGSAPALGAGCRAFESHYSDQRPSGINSRGP